MKVHEVVRERDVAAPVEEVWGRVDDVDALSGWFALADRVEVLDGAGQGRRQRTHGQWGRKQSEVDQVVVEHQPPRRLVWVHEAERLDGRPAPRLAADTRVAIDLVPLPDGHTRVRLTSRQTPAGPLTGLLMRLLGTRQITTAFEESLRALDAQLRPTP